MPSSRPLRSRSQPGQDGPDRRPRGDGCDRARREHMPSCGHSARVLRCLVSSDPAVHRPRLHAHRRRGRHALPCRRSQASPRGVAGAEQNHTTRNNEPRSSESEARCLDLVDGRCPKLRLIRSYAPGAPQDLWPSRSASTGPSCQWLATAVGSRRPPRRSPTGYSLTPNGWPGGWPSWPHDYPRPGCGDPCSRPPRQILFLDTCTLLDLARAALGPDLTAAVRAGIELRADGSVPERFGSSFRTSCPGESADNFGGSLFLPLRPLLSCPDSLIPGGADRDDLLVE